MKTSSDLKKFLLYQLPYIFYISFLLYWFYDTYADDRTINYFAMGVAMAIFVQFVFQIKIVGVSMGVIGVLFSIFFLFSLHIFLTLGIILAILSFLMGLIMTISNLMAKSNQKRHS